MKEAEMKEVWTKLLEAIDKEQQEMLQEIVENTPNLVTDEEELIYWVALDKIETEDDDYELWERIRYEAQKFQWLKKSDLHWFIVNEDRIVMEITRDDVFKYTDREILENNYAKYL